MIQRIALVLLLSLGFSAQGQILQPAKWSTDVSKKEVSVGDEVELIFYARIDKDWYLYSTDFDPDLGPMVTEFVFEKHPSFELKGAIRPIGAKKKYDDIWEGEYTYFVGKAEFRQTVKILSDKPVIKGSYEYQVCTDIDGRCIPFEDDFQFSNIKVTGASPSPKTTDQEPQPVQDEIAEESSVENEKPTASKEDATSNEAGVIEAIDLDESGNASLWAFMILAFLTGFAALVTPCVFPMIPMTVTFFLKEEGGKKAIRNGIVFGISIIAIYTLLGTLFALLLGADGLNDLATNWIPNVIAFVIFFVFALSFLGLFDIVLPSSIVNKVDAQADRGGMIGIFFMAFTLALVSFSCTVPIVGSILVLSAGGEILKPILGMLAYSFAFALPFALFAIFPGWLKSLPKSGGWLNAVKVTLGFLELALAFKFLSIADQAYHWNILDREVFITIWIVIFFLLGLYLLGKITLPHDSVTERVSVPRLMLSILSFCFAVYLLPGLFGAPLKALSGYLPPMSTHDFDIPGLLMQSGNGNGSADENELCEKPKYADKLHLPLGIKGYFDYEQALACAKEQGKPLFIDFTGHGCVNCREMEARVWSNPEVLRRLKTEFVVVALYVDEKTELPDSAWYTSSYDGKVKKTIGKQNADFQISRFKNNAQPYYIILDTEERLLAKPLAYDLNPQNFVQFLDGAKQNFEDGRYYLTE